MKAKATGLVLATLLSLGAGAARADHGTAILGAAIGGAAGAALGHSLGDDRADVIVWSALGSAAGAAIAQSAERRHREEVVIYRPVHVHERYVVMPPVRVIHVHPVPPHGPRWHLPRHAHHHHHFHPRHWRHYEAW